MLLRFLELRYLLRFLLGLDLGFNGVEVENVRYVGVIIRVLLGMVRYYGFVRVLRYFDFIFSMAGIMVFFV